MPPEPIPNPTAECADLYQALNQIGASLAQVSASLAQVSDSLRRASSEIERLARLARPTEPQK
jgi:ABC-type transporter Mla subunit MlaD